MAAITTAVVGVGGLALGAKGQSDARKDAKIAAAQQQGQAESAIARQEEAAALGLPFVEAGTAQLGALQDPNTFSSDIEEITGSPLFEATFGQNRRIAEGQIANEGTLGSGTGSMLLDQARTSSILPLLQQRQQDRFRLAGMGQAAAAGQVAPAAMIGGLQTDIGATNAAATIARGNLQRQGNADLLRQLPGVLSSVQGAFTQTPPPPVQVGGIQGPNTFGGFA